jgi:cell wall-associated NlpC family hydrolase
MHLRRLAARAIVPVALAAAILSATAPANPTSAATIRTEADQIVHIARNQIGDPWRSGATGPSAFDCSGLARYAFRKAGDGHVIRAGRLRSASALLHWFRNHHRASRHHPRRGDLVIWGGGSHVGIYIGHGRAISTLTEGVRVHRVHAVTARFTAYLHTRMWKRLAD